MIVASAGVVMMVPNFASLTGLAALVAGSEVDVRLVEEPHLRTPTAPRTTRTRRPSPGSYQAFEFEEAPDHTPDPSANKRSSNQAICRVLCEQGMRIAGHPLPGLIALNR
jgi:hypothetical protein